MAGKKRYPGVKPFETADKNLFFGRDKDIQELGLLIGLEKLVVLFGKSGYGKTSLVNAGLIPLLRSVEYENSAMPPLMTLRFGNYQAAERNLSPVEVLLASLSQQKNDGIPVTAGAFLENICEDHSLWYHFKRAQSKDNGPTLLIFDQFEEFFSYPARDQETFKKQLAELLYVKIPQPVRERIAELDAEQRQFLSLPLDIKVLIVMRSDRLSLLDSLKDQLPAILNKRFELKGLNEDQARAAILKPAAMVADSEPFDCPPFTFSPDAIDLILTKLGERRKQSVYHSIEAFQLQILCEYIEEIVRSGRVSGNVVQPGHFEHSFEEIYEGYYQRLLDRLPAENAHAAQMLIEEALIFVDETSGEARRLSVDADVLVHRYAHLGVSRDTLKILENAFLLRREHNNVGGFSYELSHDTLLPPILKKYFKRRNEAERLEALRQKEEAELRIHEEREKRIEAEKRRRKARLLATLAIVGFFMSLITSAWAWKKQQDAQESLNAFKEEEKKRILTEFKQTLDEIRGVLRAACPDSVQMHKLRTIPQKYPEDSALQRQVRSIDSLLTLKNCKK